MPALLHTPLHILLSGAMQHIHFFFAAAFFVASVFFGVLEALLNSKWSDFSPNLKLDVRVGLLSFRVLLTLIFLFFLYASKCTYGRFCFENFSGFPEPRREGATPSRNHPSTDRGPGRKPHGCRDLHARILGGLRR